MQLTKVSYAIAELRSSNRQQIFNQLQFSLSVSRMEINISFQCFMGDEGRPFTYALQEEYVNHFMVL